MFWSFWKPSQNVMTIKIYFLLAVFEDPYHFCWKNVVMANNWQIRVPVLTHDSYGGWLVNSLSIRSSENVKIWYFYIHKLLLSEEKIKINWKTLSNYINVKFKYGHGVPTTQITSDWLDNKQLGMDKNSRRICKNSTFIDMNLVKTLARHLGSPLCVHHVGWSLH